LTVNAAKDATELISKLRALHIGYKTHGDSNPKYADLKYCGVDLNTGKPRNNLKAGVL